MSLSDRRRLIRGEDKSGSQQVAHRLTHTMETEMSTTTQVHPAATATEHVTTDRRPVWKHGLAAAAGAAAVTTVLAAVASAAGVSFEGPDGTAIPLLGFTQLTFVFSMIGVGLAAILARKARRPRSTFVRTTVALTALSVVPDFTFGFDAATACSLATLHVVAAAIVVPTIARRLSAAR